MKSPFDANCRLVTKESTRRLSAAYMQKCGAGIVTCFEGVAAVDLYECEATGYRFWRPETVAGNESFYQTLSQAWPSYYQTDRWEYPIVRRLCKRSSHVLEIGCGRGYFLKSIERSVAESVGLELNSEAIANRVTSSPVKRSTIESYAQEMAGRFDLVCSYHVLEHVTDPASFLKAALACLKPGGWLVVSTPNYRHVPFANHNDPFDLPPHHMGHFSPDVYGRIARHFQVELREIHEQIRVPVPEQFSPSTRRRVHHRLLTRLSRELLRLSFKLSHEPGPAVIAVFRKTSVAH